MMNECLPLFMSMITAVYMINAWYQTTLKEQEETTTSEEEHTVEVVGACTLMELSDPVDEYISAHPMEHEMSSHSLSMLYTQAGTASHKIHGECTNTCQVSSWSEATPNCCNPGAGKCLRANQKCMVQ